MPTNESGTPAGSVALTSGNLVYRDSSGNEIMTIDAANRKLSLPSGATIDMAGTTQIGGTTVNATAAEINRATDVSGRLVAAGSTLTVTEALHDGKTILLNQAAGCTITLPAASASGMRLRFVVTVKPTSNQHRINVVGDDKFEGQINLIDMDGVAQAAYAAIDSADNDQINLNGTTTGGQIGDFIVLEDVLADKWHVIGFGVVPAGSNPATPFATGQVS